MLGAYVGFSVAAHASFWSALVIAPLAVGLAGAALERCLLRCVRPHGHLAELLLTFGAAYLIGKLVKLGWGLSPLAARIPASLDGPLFTLYGAAFARYRAFMIAVSLAMLIALYAVLCVSKAGLIVRAALAGVIGAPLFVIEPSMVESLGSIVFVVVVIGGLGSLSGALVASLLVGCVQTLAVASDVSLGDVLATFGTALPPQWSSLTLAQLAPLIPYALLIAMLVLRPRGLFGRRDDHA